MATEPKRRGRPPKPQPQNAVLAPPEGIGPISTVQPDEAYGARTDGSYGSIRHPKLGKVQNYLRRLPDATDDLSRDLGPAILERMCNDSAVSSSIESQIAQAISKGLAVKPSYPQKDHPLYQPSLEAYDLVSYSLDYCHENLMDYLEVGMTETLEDMARAMRKFGNSVAEVTFRVHQGKFAPLSGKMIPSFINVLSPETYGYIVDPFKRVPALAVYTGRGSGGIDVMPAMSLMPTAELSIDQLPPGWEALPIAKFMTMKNGSKCGDPRGVSSLRPAFNPWLLKIQLMPELLKFLRQFAGPSIKGNTPENAKPGPVDPDTGLRTPAKEMLFNALLDFQNGSVLASDFGTEIDIIQAANDGHAFLEAISMLDQQIVKAISYTVLTEALNHQTRAASSTGKDISDMPVLVLKNKICSMVRRQLFKKIVYFNMGPELAQLVTPIATLGNLAQEDRNATVMAFASAGWKVTPSQYMQIANDLELDTPSQEELTLLLQADKTAAMPKPTVAPGQPVKKPSAGVKP